MLCCRVPYIRCNQLGSSPGCWRPWILTKHFSLYVIGSTCKQCVSLKCIVFLLDLGSFTNLLMCIYVLKIQRVKLAHTLEIDKCFLTCNNQFWFCLKCTFRGTVFRKRVVDFLFAMVTARYSEGSIFRRFRISGNETTNVVFRLRFPRKRSERHAGRAGFEWTIAVPPNKMWIWSGSSRMPRNISLCSTTQRVTAVWMLLTVASCISLRLYVTSSNQLTFVDLQLVRRRIVWAIKCKNRFSGSTCKSVKK